MREVLDLIPANSRKADQGAALADLRYVVTIDSPGHGRYGLAAFRYERDAETFVERWGQGVGVRLEALAGPTAPDAVAAEVRRERAAIGRYLRAWGHADIASQIEAGSATP